MIFLILLFHALVFGVIIWTRVDFHREKNRGYWRGRYYPYLDKNHKDYDPEFSKLVLH